MKTRTPSQKTPVEGEVGLPRPGAARPMGSDPAPSQRQPLPPALKARSASRELTPQPEPAAGVRGRGCLGTQEPSALAGGEGLRPRPAPPGSRCFYLVSVCRAGGLRSGAPPRWVMHMRRSRAQIPHRAHTHSGRACALNPTPSPGPTLARTAPCPGACAARMCVHGSPAVQRVCEQTK